MSEEPRHVATPENFTAFSGVEERQDKEEQQGLLVEVGDITENALDEIGEEEDHDTYEVVDQDVDGDDGGEDGHDSPLTVRSADEQYSQGIDFIRRHLYQKALRYFSRSIFLAPGEPLPYVARAEAYTHLNDLRSAVANYRRALSLMRDPVAVEDLRSRLAQVLDTYGLIFLRNDRPEEALRYIQESLDEKPHHPVVQLHQALCLISLKRDVEAQSLLQSIVKDPLVEADASVLLIQLLTKQKDFAGGKKMLEEILFKYPDHPRILDMERTFDLAFHEYRSKAQESLNVEALTRCIAAFGEDAELYRMRAISHASRKSYTLAVQDLFSCINKSGGSNPTASDMMGNLLCNIADELAEAEDFVAAVTYYTEAIKWCEELAETYIARGDCLQRIGKHETALADYKLVLDREPNHELARQRLGQLHDTWGSILYNQGNWELAEAEFTRAISYTDTLPAFHYHRALARIMLKQQTFAVRDLISCRDLGATDPDIVRLVNQFCLPSSVAGTGSRGAYSEGSTRPPPTIVPNRDGTIPMAEGEEGIDSSMFPAALNVSQNPPGARWKRGSGSRRKKLAALQQRQSFTGNESGEDNSDDKNVLTPKLKREAELKLSNREYAQLKRDGATGAELCKLRIEKTDENNMMKGKYNPTAIRDYVKHSTIASNTAVMVDTDVRGGREIKEMESKETERAVPQHIGGPLWKGTKTQIPSRLDLVQVSEPAPVPARYAQDMRKRQLVERERQDRKALVEGGKHAPVQPQQITSVQQSVNKKRQGARLAGFATSAPGAVNTGAPTFSVGRKDVTVRPPASSKPVLGSNTFASSGTRVMGETSGAQPGQNIQS